MSESNNARNTGSAYDGIALQSLSALPTAASEAQADQRLRFREDLGLAGTLDAALTRRSSKTLIVTFHGALDRDKFSIPRFERARMTEAYGTSCLYWADPSLWLDESLALAWYTGAGSTDLFPILAEHSLSAARAVGAEQIIFTGSSGGGFAALQTSALVPGSTALVFNPQTAISKYWQTVQRKYLSVCQPALLPVAADDYDFSTDWSEGRGPRFSAVERYRKATENKVTYWTNVNDWHHAKHFRPFRNAESTPGGDSRMTVHTYRAAKGHHAPAPEIFTEAMDACLSTLS